MSWVIDDNNRRMHDIREKFMTALREVSKESTTNYYDFLLVAKQLGFRFEEASHLMSLKNHFMKNKNTIDKRRLVDLLMVHQSYIRSQTLDKLQQLCQYSIVKFNLPDTQFDPIQEVTNEDEQYYGEAQQLNNSDSQSWSGVARRQSSEHLGKQHTDSEVDYREKIDIIVSIKMQEMSKKLAVINSCEDLFSAFDPAKRGLVNLQEFKRAILKIFSESREKLKISQDDIKTLFYLLDTDRVGELAQDKFAKLTRPEQFTEELREFYRSRVNPALIKNTEFKRGKYKNQIQIFQVKNPSLLQLEQIEKAVLNQQALNTLDREEIKRTLIVSRKPHFGPLKHSTYHKKRDLASIPPVGYKQAVESGSASVWMQRDRIQKILKASKEKRRQHHSNETIASKLRSLFIHKVILPREKMLDEEKEQEQSKFRRTKGVSNYLAIRPLERK